MCTLLNQIQRSVTSVAKGLGVTLKNYSREKTTLNYPEEKPILAERYRGLHGLTIDPDTGEENCIGCMACARVCPDNLISMTLEKREGHKGRYPVNFQIDLNPCCFCGLCSEVCPTPYKALVMTHDFELAGESRADLVLTKDKLMFYARRDQVQRGDLPLEYPMLSKEQGDDLQLLDEVARQRVAASVNVQEAVSIVNPLNAKPRPATPKPAHAPEKPVTVPTQASWLVAHTASGPPIEPDYSGMERVERSKAKATYIKAKRAYDEAQALPEESAGTVAAVESASSAPTTMPVEPDYTGMERVERSKAKAAYIKAKRAYDEAQAANPAAAPATLSQPEWMAARAAPIAPVEPDYTGMERVERAKAKATYIKAKRAYEEAQAGNSPAVGARIETEKGVASGTSTDVGPSVQEFYVPPSTTNAAREALMAAIGRTGIGEFGSGLDAGMAAEAEGLSPETQKAMAPSKKPKA